MKLASLAVQWDDALDARSALSVSAERRRPFVRMVANLADIAPLRFQPYQLDEWPDYRGKLTAWLGQFDAKEQPAALLLALNLVFVTQQQFEVLQRRLFEHHLRRTFLDAIISARALPAFDYLEAEKHLDTEMDATLFIPNSDSSPLNSFVHLNDLRFKNRTVRRLLGPEVEFWTYAGQRRSELAVQQIATDYERAVLSTDTRIQGKKRLVVLEDFSGSGSDLLKTLNAIHRTKLPISEVILAPVMATAEALRDLRAECARLQAQGSRKYSIDTALEIPDKLRCFDGPVRSYLADVPGVVDLPAEVKAMSERIYAARFSATHLMAENKFGFGGLALAFAFYTNCPDNALPVIWMQTPDWRPLFRRSSRVI